MGARQGKTAVQEECVKGLKNDRFPHPPDFYQAHHPDYFYYLFKTDSFGWVLVKNMNKRVLLLKIVYLVIISLFLGFFLNF